MEQTKRTMRLKYFLRTGIQQRFLRVNILLVIFITLAIAYSIYQLTINILGPSLEEVYPPGLLKELYDNLDTAFGMRLLFILFVVTIAAFLISHTVAGPAYHIERDLNAMAKGDLTKRIYLRKHDELKPIANNLNEMADHLSRSLNSIEKNLDTMEKLSQELRHNGGDLAGRQDITGKITVSLKEVRDVLSQFKIK